MQNEKVLLATDQKLSKIKSFTDLRTWQIGHQLVLEIYKVTSAFPKEEVFGLTSQLRRAVVSFTSNIAEGRRRGSKKDFRQFLIIAYGSGSELETQLEIAKRLSFGQLSDYQNTLGLLNEVMRMLNKLTSTLRS